MRQPELGILIADLRKKQGLTQEELVDRCNINVRTIQRIEAGEVNPRSYTVKNILEALGTTIDNVFKEEEATESTPQNEHESHEKSTAEAQVENEILYLIGGLTGIGYLITDTLGIFFALAASLGDGKVLSTFGYAVFSMVDLVLFGVFYFALFRVGLQKKLRLFAYAALAFIGVKILLRSWDVFSYANDDVMTYYVELIASSSGLFVYGLGYIFLGIGLFTQRKMLGDRIKWAGIFGIVGGFGFALIFLFPVGILCTLIFEILLIAYLFAQVNNTTAST